ncbi:MAG: lytic transglycosylase domain-containing protein [Thermoanaerobaculaceae bacterium]|nr:lytic transglycosylase domain-containing protein [Thermoanaerobaculaceae bacterium]
MQRSLLLLVLLWLPAAAWGGGGGVIVVTDPDGTKRVFNVAAVVPTGRPVPNGSAVRQAELWPKVQEIATAHGVDPRLVDLMIRMESGYNPTAVSPKGARGVMQLMPATASLYGVADPFDPFENIRGGVRYLKDLLERFQYDLSLALAAYNAGPEAVEQYRGVPPFEETRNYVASILAAYNGTDRPVLSGGFGRVAGVYHRPVEVVREGGTTVVSNLKGGSDSSPVRRLTLR